MPSEQTFFLPIPNINLKLCIRTIEGRKETPKPTLVFLHGLASSMSGSKGTFLAEIAHKHGYPMMRLDYRGHGESEGIFTDGTLSDWIEDTLLAIQHFTNGPLILIGSSIGAWVGLKAALHMPENIAAFIGLAPAIDITRHLYNALTDQQKKTLHEQGICERPSAYGAPLPITRAMIEDGNTHLLLNQPIQLTCPIRLLHGQADTDVPYTFSLQLAEALKSQDIETLLLKDGDHRLSRPHDLTLLEHIILGVG